MRILNISYLLYAAKINVYVFTKLKLMANTRGGTLEISGWGWAGGTLEPLAYTRFSSAEFRYPMLEQISQIAPAVDTEADSRKFKLADLNFSYF